LGISGTILEMNSRIDLLMLGYLTNHTAVGVFSFASMIAEGIAQFPLMVRVSVDPLLGRHFSRGDKAEIETMSRQVKRVFFPAMSALGITAVLLFPMAVKLLVGTKTVEGSWGVLAILMTGILLNSGYRPFLGIVLQGGRPEVHTLLSLGLIAANLCLNRLMIPMLGIYGSALSTAICLVLETVFIVHFARRLFSIRL
jgi:O-antigen/teichoic acid export membrane protein